MAIVNIRDMLYHAYRNKYAIGAFDTINLEFLDGIIMAAERYNSPVILSVSESRFRHNDFEMFMPAVEAAARNARVPVAIHLNRTANIKSAIRGINLGCNSAMINTEKCSVDEIICTSRSLVKMASGCGISVEGELDYVPVAGRINKSRRTCDVFYTDADEARVFVEQTGVDFLSVAIGNIRGNTGDQPTLDFRRLDQINRAVNIPLVIHGGTGMSSDQYRQLIQNGVAKIHYSTGLMDMAGIRIRDNTRVSHRGGFMNLIEGVREAISAEVEYCIQQWGSIDRAQEILSTCTPWAPVEHLIVYNISGGSQKETDAMMAKGRRILSAIPGVREVVTGRAIKSDAKYYYTWLVRFCHPAVIDSYREHPAHVAFADNLFRPIAGDRISIDYQTIETLPDASNPQAANEHSVMRLVQ